MDVQLASALDSAAEAERLERAINPKYPPPDPAELAAMTSARAGLEADCRG